MSFYQAIGPGGLAAIAPDLIPADRRWLATRLHGRRDVLDAGCGIGRVAIPLAEAGHRVVAVDLDPGLVAEGRRLARGRGLPLRFAVADIRDLPGTDARFDAVICLWSTFQHLLTAADQARALAGFHRVLRPGGMLLLEMTDGSAPAVAADLARRGLGRDRRIAQWRIRGATIRCRIHDPASLGRTLAASAFARHRIGTRRVRGVSRLVAAAWKDGPLASGRR